MPHPTTQNPGRGHYWTGVGDLTIAPRLLLTEDLRYTITTNLYVRLPTGSILNGNGAATLSAGSGILGQSGGRSGHPRCPGRDGPDE